MLRFLMKYRFKIANYLLGGILLFVLFHFVNVIGVDEVRTNISRLGWGFVPIMLCYLGSTLLASMAWKLCFVKSDSQVPYWYLVVVRLFSESIALINPTNIVGGEALKIYYLKKHKVSTPDAVNSVIISRALLMLSQVVLIIIAAIYFVLHYDLINVKAVSVLPLFIGVLGSLFVLYSLVRFVFPFALNYLFANVLKKKNLTYLRSLVLLKQLKSKPIVLLKIYALSTIHWIGGGLELYLILHFLGVDISLVQSLMADVSVSTMKVSGAFIPGQIGVEEFSLKFILSFIGIGSSSVWITASIIRRLKQVVWIGLSLILFSTYQLLYTIKHSQIGSIIRNT